MSLFIAGLAFLQAMHFAERAKLGILARSLASALFGFAILRLAPR